MSEAFVKVGDHIVNLPYIAAAHWEGSKLFVHLSGGRFLTFYGQQGTALWKAIEDRGLLDLLTGELVSPSTAARSAPAAVPAAASTAAVGTTE